MSSAPSPEIVIDRIISCRPQGFALVSVVVVMSVLFAFAIIAVGVSLSSRRTGTSYQQSMSAEQLAEAGINKAVFCLNATNGDNCGGKKGKDYVGETNVSFGGGNWTTVLTGDDKTKSIISTGTSLSRKKIVKAIISKIPTGYDLDVGYAVQAGEGGVFLTEGADLKEKKKNVLYSNSDIICDSDKSLIEGTAVVAKVGGKIDGCQIKASAYADKILNSKVVQDAYYQNDPADIAGTTAHTKHPNSPTPAVDALPDVNLALWHKAAEKGGTYIGDYTPTDNSILGPLKIYGNLNIPDTINVVLKGPVWVVGDINMLGHASLTLHDMHETDSVIMLADDPHHRDTKGFINLSKDAQIKGTNALTSFVVFYSTNTSKDDANPAIDAAHQTKGGIFLAPDGVILLDPGSKIYAAAGYRVVVKKDAHAEYKDGGHDPTDIVLVTKTRESWEVIPDTWREPSQ